MSNVPRASSSRDVYLRALASLRVSPSIQFTLYQTWHSFMIRTMESDAEGLKTWRQTISGRSIYPSIHQTSIHLSNILSIHSFTHPSIHLSFHTLIHPSTYLLLQTYIINESFNCLSFFLIFLPSSFLSFSSFLLCFVIIIYPHTYIYSVCISLCTDQLSFL